jgi:hypothetical protein
MDNTDFTDTDFGTALWPKLHDGMRSHSNDCAPHNIHTANDGIQDSNAPYDTASSTTVPTTLKKMFPQTNHTCPALSSTVTYLAAPQSVPESWAMLGPRKVPFFASATILPVHQTLQRKTFLDARSVAPKLVRNTYGPEVFPLAANSAAAATNVSADDTDRGAFC